MGRISAKLHLYNETLASFQKIEGLVKPREEDVKVYGEYLANRGPLIEAESGFIEHAEDLVSLAPKRLHHRAHEEEDIVMRSRARPQRRLTATAHSNELHANIEHRPHMSNLARQSHQQALFLAALLSILVPMIVFHAIPTFSGRMIVALLVGLGIVGSMAQTGATEMLSLGKGGKRVIATTWGAGMVLLALIV